MIMHTCLLSCLCRSDEKDRLKMTNNNFKQLEAEIAVEIGLHTDKYKDAGKWLDNYCCQIKTKTIPQVYLSDTLHYWLKKYKGYESSVTAEDGRCILFITLLLLQPDSEIVAGIITEFAKQPWVTEDEIDSRAWAGIPLKTGEYAYKWEKLIRSALEQVKLRDKLDATTKTEKQENGGEETKVRITKDEANVRARTLIQENPNITIRKLAGKIPCSIGLVSKLPVWQALQEYKKKTFGTKKPKIVPLTKELEYILGSKDENLNQLIAEQENDEKQDKKRSKYYLNNSE
jgi:hypothetical protein